jgi:hypothetical protein
MYWHLVQLRAVDGAVKARLNWASGRETDGFLQRATGSGDAFSPRFFVYPLPAGRFCARAYRLIQSVMSPSRASAHSRLGPSRICRTATVFRFGLCDTRRVIEKLPGQEEASFFGAAPRMPALGYVSTLNSLEKLITSGRGWVH